nr:MAG TPA: hypothetical protein [Caudoviricetes sp.]
MGLVQSNSARKRRLRSCLRPVYSPENTWRWPQSSNPRPQRWTVASPRPRFLWPQRRS